MLSRKIDNSRQSTTAQAPHTRKQRRLLPASLAAVAVALGTLAAFLFPAVASAHATYVSSDPAANSVVKVAPSVVTVHYAENVNPTGSDIIIYDSRGKQVSTAPAQVDRANLKTMTVNMQGNGSEVYLVEWHTVSADDGDPDIGAFYFVVNKTGKSDLVPSQSSAVTSSSSSGDTPGWVAALIGIAGMVVGGAGGLFLTRRVAR